MILARLDQCRLYACLHPRFAAALDFLARPDLRDLPLGRQEIAGPELYAMLMRSPGRTRSETLLEIHRRYIDIQLVLAGRDEMGWRALGDCHQPDGPYNADKDYQLFRDPAESWLSVPADHLAIFFPDDAHAPLVGSGEIHKVVVKVAVSEGE
jgi:YhcH/YjgK/YiaL family protein